MATIEHRGETLMRKKKRALLTSDIRLDKQRVLGAGERGTVVHLETDEAGIYSADILMDNHHHGLDYWDNVAHIAGPELENVKFSDHWGVVCTCVPRVAMVALCVLALIGLFETTEDALNLHTGLHQIFVGQARALECAVDSYNCVNGDTQSLGGKEHGRDDTIPKGAS